ncbi:DGCR2 [Branchiostoma lanceolatum]|uniref:DGCR2 protein n=1 Tax=Branchiostoma lanceolatum TaxID=7740 RepID=A0A8J9W4F5_BRALA|nr:DGCR2 [Branchiostoma lanceolatum]
MLSASRNLGCLAVLFHGVAIIMAAPQDADGSEANRAQHVATPAHLDTENLGHVRPHVMSWDKAPLDLGQPGFGKEEATASLLHGDSPNTCPEGWYFHARVGSCYKAFQTKTTYSQAQETCQRLGSYLATISSDNELRFIIEHKWEDLLVQSLILDGIYQKFWMGYHYVTQNNVSFWRVTNNQAEANSDFNFIQSFNPVLMSTQHGDMLCGQLQYLRNELFGDPLLWSWYAINCENKSAFLCKKDLAKMKCINSKGQKVADGQVFTPQGHDACMTCTCHMGEAQMCITAQCDRPQKCTSYQMSPDKCCEFTCMDPNENNNSNNYNGSKLSMTHGMRLVVSCLSSFLILSLLLFMVYRLRQRRLEAIYGANQYGRRNRASRHVRRTRTNIIPAHLFRPPPLSPSADLHVTLPPYDDPPPPYSAVKPGPPVTPGDKPPPPYDMAIMFESAYAGPPPRNTPDNPMGEIQSPQSDSSQQADSETQQLVRQQERESRRSASHHDMASQRSSRCSSHRNSATSQTPAGEDSASRATRSASRRSSPRHSSASNRSSQTSSEAALPTDSTTESTFV